MSIHLHVIYRPRDGKLNLFIDDFTEYSTSMANQSRIILTGYFNVHINDDQDQQTEILRNTISALGLNQHMTFLTHRIDSILHVVINELISNRKVCETMPDPYILDYLALLFKLNIIKPNAKKEKVSGI